MISSVSQRGGMLVATSAIALGIYTCEPNIFNRTLDMKFLKISRLEQSHTGAAYISLVRTAVLKRIARVEEFSPFFLVQCSW